MMHDTKEGVKRRERERYCFPDTVGLCVTMFEEVKESVLC